jgi:calcium/calmodulin-dependent protein kinase (CaM kinase) II
MEAMSRRPRRAAGSVSLGFVEQRAIVGHHEYCAEELRMHDPVAAELLQLNQRLLDSIARADWATYQELCDASLTAFEPEAVGQLVEGLEFHRFYFDLGGVQGRFHTAMCSPKVRVMGDAAVVAYVRLNQRVGADGTPGTSAVEETRVWQRLGGRWKHVHFHRSPVG